MKAAARCLCLFLCALVLILPAYGISAASDIKNYTTISADGTASVTVNLTVRLEQADTNLVFPLPENAENASINGSSVRISQSGGTRYISISKATGSIPGTFSMSIHYTVKNVLSFGKGNILYATVPILSGFAYPTEYAEFSVIFPGDITGIPTFSSLYMQEAMDSILSYSIEGSALNGVVLKELKDHDSFSVKIPVDPQQFSEAAILRAGGTWVSLAILGLFALALVYWLCFLRFLPILPQRQTLPPNDITAGDVGSILSGQGGDLSLTVLSWAQMGYLLLETDQRGRILIKKRMDMGNERSTHEQKVFSALFRKRDVVDGGSRAYALLCKKVSGDRKAVKSLFRTFSGDCRIFCWICAFAGFFAGIPLTQALFREGILQYFWGCLLCCACLLTARRMQDLSGLWFLSKWDRKLQALGCILFWLLLAYLSGEAVLCLIIIGAELLAGVLGCFGGLRNTAGRRSAAELLGLRKYLSRLSKENPAVSENPDYFFKLLPFAMALGVEDRLAKAFDAASLPECTYLVYGSRHTPRASELVRKAREILSAMDERQKLLFLERFFGKR